MLWPSVWITQAEALTDWGWVGVCKVQSAAVLRIMLLVVNVVSSSLLLLSLRSPFCSSFFFFFLSALSAPNLPPFLVRDVDG